MAVCFLLFLQLPDSSTALSLPVWRHRESLTPSFALLWHFVVSAGAVRGSVSSGWGSGCGVHPVPQQKLLQEGFVPWLLNRTAVLVALLTFKICLFWWNRSFLWQPKRWDPYFPEHLRWIWRQYFAFPDLWACIANASRWNGFLLDIVETRCRCTFISLSSAPPEDLHVLADTTSTCFGVGRAQKGFVLLFAWATRAGSAFLGLGTSWGFASLLQSLGWNFYSISDCDMGSIIPFPVCIVDI